MGDVVFEAFTGTDHHAARAEMTALRLQVFVGEQAVPFILEIDARDFLKTTTHVVGLRAGKVVATARILSDHPGMFHVGRVAVAASERGTGIGKLLMLAAHRQLRTQLDPGEKAHVLLDAQRQAAGFYRSVGYTETAKEAFFDAGIEHVEMAKVIDLSEGPL